MRSGKYLVSLAVLAAAVAAPVGAHAQTQPAPDNNQPQVAQPDNGGVNWEGVGIGAATLLANVGYIPAKTVYAILGGITGGAGYALTGGNQQAANSIWRSSLGGDYVLTPSMIRGQAPIHFSGPSTAPATGSNQPLGSNAPPAASTASAPAVTSSAPNYASSAPAAPSSSSTSMATSAAGAPPYTTSRGAYGSPSIGTTHITTSITSEPGDAGAGPVR